MQPGYAFSCPESTSLETRAARQAATYWRVRSAATLDRLEREARRMLLLERELTEFANEYYHAVGGVAERLAAVEQRAAAAVPAPHEAAEITRVVDEALLQRDTTDARRQELKTRYRSLAKEIHPDRAMVVEGAGRKASTMQCLNEAYQQGDLATLLRLEAQMALGALGDGGEAASAQALEHALREVERAADTYATNYRAMLHSPLNELMLRAMSARLAGRDWMGAVVEKLEHRIAQQERAVALASIAEIGAWRRQTVQAAS